VLIGVFISVVLELSGISSSPSRWALLPLSTSAPIAVGGWSATWWSALEEAGER